MTYRVRWEPADRVQTLDVKQVVALEQAIAADGTSLAELMDRAGASAAQFIRERWDANHAVLIFCGTGNNGGDGWVVGRLLAQAGYGVRLVCSHEPEEIGAQPAHDAAVRCLSEVGDTSGFTFELAPDADTVHRLAASADIVVDALLGTGFHYDTLREPTRTYVAAIADAVGLGGDARSAATVTDDVHGGSLAPAGIAPDGDETSAPVPARVDAPVVVAVDVPSGLNAQTGQASDPVVRADYTVTMMTRKTGMRQPAAADLCGQISVARIADIEKYLA